MDNVRRITVDLGTAGKTLIENFPLCAFAVEQFDGTTGSVVLTGNAQDREAEAFIITAGASASIAYAGAQHPTQWYIHNRTAQSGKTLVLLVGRPGATVNPGYSITAGSANAENQATQIAYEASMDATLANVEEEIGNRDSVKHGKQTVGVTAAQFSAQAIEDGFEVVLKAAIDNTGKIYIGGATVTVPAGVAPGFELSPGESLSLRVTNLNVLYGIADTAAQTLFWIVEKTA